MHYTATMMVFNSPALRLLIIAIRGAQIQLDTAQSMKQCTRHITHQRNQHDINKQVPIHTAFHNNTSNGKYTSVWLRRHVARIWSSERYNEIIKKLPIALKKNSRMVFEISNSNILLTSAHGESYNMAVKK